MRQHVLLPLLALALCLGLFFAAKAAPARDLSAYRDAVQTQPQSLLGCDCGCLHCGC